MRLTDKEQLGLQVVPVLYRGPWDKTAVRAIEAVGAASRFGDDREGYVVRLADGFHYRAFRQSVAKYVRKNHVQTDVHWKTQVVVPNKLGKIVP